METPKNVFTSTADIMRKYQDMILENQEEKEENMIEYRRLVREKNTMNDIKYYKKL